ncbi:MAG: hypothetical protein H7Y88_02210 [Phycisphaerales bacterium]|nr:hypothetical protein [Phycisphaerales bacterium]
MQAAEPRGVLRLVGAGAVPVLRLSRQSDTPDATRAEAARRAVERENSASAGLSVHDLRSIFAARVGEQLQGGRAAILTPDRRETLRAIATRLGIRPFDASLVIAIVQDGARSGEGVLTPAVQGRVRMVGSGRPAGNGLSTLGHVVRSIVTAAALAALMLWAMTAWITR